MSGVVKVGIIGLVMMILVGVVVGVKCIGYNNKEVELRNQFSAQMKVNESYFDKMWKILQQQAGVVDKYQKDFKGIYSGIMEGRYSNGNGKMMQWVQERNPNFDSGMYKTLMNSIEAQREGFHREQSKAIDIKMVHDNLRQKFPSSLIVGSKDALELNVITSGKTKKTFETGEENDVDLFKSK